MKESLRRNRRYWELLWQALKLSDDYEKFLNGAGLRAVERYNTRLRNHRPGMKPVVQPPTFQKHRIWIAVYDRFGNVHQEDFDDWWTRREKRIQASPAHYFQCCADYGEFWAGFGIDQVFANSGPIEDTEDFKKRFKARFVERIRKSRLVHIVLDPEEDRINLDREIDQVISAKRRRSGRGGGPNLAQVEKALHAYDLSKKQGLRLREVIATMETPDERVVNRDGKIKRLPSFRVMAEKKGNSADPEWMKARTTYERIIKRGDEIVRLLSTGCFPSKEHSFL